MTQMLDNPLHKTLVALAAAILLAGSASLAGEGKEAPGRRLLDEFFRKQVQAVSERGVPKPTNAESWPAERERLRAELREMLGLPPAEQRGDLRARITGRLVREDLGVIVERLHFQSLAGLYVTANLYRPLEVAGKLPSILYLCGHGQVKIDGVSYGNKASYQHHPLWFARNGYVCLIIDTLQLGEIEGKHHGTYKLDMWWWVSRGYTPAGVEAWNSIRALDYLESRPEVDPKKLGVTGRSGGGIGTWWIAALDDRPAALVPVAGITDLRNHVLTGCIDGHCDCNFPVNLYQWDFPALAVLAAPKPLLFSNSDKDSIFPLDGVLRVHGKLKEIYGILGAPERLGLCIVEGPHADTQELQVPAFRWMNRWLKEKPKDAVPPLAERLLDPKELRALDGIPAGERNTTIEESFVPAASPPDVPATLPAFESLRGEMLAKLKAKTFRNSPDPGGPLDVEEGPAAEGDGLLLRSCRFLSEEPFCLTLWIVTKSGAKSPRRFVLRILDEEGWRDWTQAGAAIFRGWPRWEAAADAGKAAALKDRLDGGETAMVLFPPRGVGPTRWSDQKNLENQLRRRFYVLGRTLAETRIFDVRRAVRALRATARPEGARMEGGPLEGAEICLEGRGEMAAVALYAGILEPSVARLDLDGLPPSHRGGIPLLNVLKVLDIPQAVALLFPRQVRLRGASAKDFSWTARAASLFEGGGRPSPLTFEP